jgi:hypothetical protein
MKAINGHIYAIIQNNLVYEITDITKLPEWCQCGVDNDVGCITAIDITNMPEVQIGWNYNADTQTFSEPEPTVISLTTQAQVMFNQYNYTPYQWNKLTKPKQAQLTAYLDDLSAIIDGTDTTSTELPTAPF